MHMSTTSLRDWSPHWPGGMCTLNQSSKLEEFPLETGESCQTKQPECGVSQQKIPLPSFTNLWIHHLIVKQCWNFPLPLDRESHSSPCIPHVSPSLARGLTPRGSWWHVHNHWSQSSRSFIYRFLFNFLVDNPKHCKSLAWHCFSTILRQHVCQPTVRALCQQISVEAKQKCCGLASGLVIDDYHWPSQHTPKLWSLSAILLFLLFFIC